MDPDFDFSQGAKALHRAVDLMASDGLPVEAAHPAVSPAILPHQGGGVGVLRPTLPEHPYETAGLPAILPEQGAGAEHVLDLLAPILLGRASRLGTPMAFAHMDPPTPWISWAISLWNASLNQNLLHPATAPVARDVEKRVVDWLAPFFGMNGGHMMPGSSLANLTALWAARECAGIREVVASNDAHLSVAKAAHILGLQYRTVDLGSGDAIASPDALGDLSKAAFVITAGTTSTGAIEPLGHAGQAAWTHVDAAWAGPLRLSCYANRLKGIEQADSVAVSAHKWLFQPKESALVLFRDSDKAHAALSFGGAYLAVPNIGMQGSHGATAAPLLATLLAWGRKGMAQRIEHCMNLAERLREFIDRDPRLVLYAEPQSGIVVWRPNEQRLFERILQRLPPGMVSTTTIDQEPWFRNVAANPNADVDAIVAALRRAIDES